MALWERAEIDPGIKTRRYCCPECGEYSLHVKHECFAECENGCFIDDEEMINELLDNADCKGHFTKEELAYHFI